MNESDLKIGLLIHFNMDCFMLGDAYAIESITEDDVVCDLYHMGRKLRDRYKEQYNSEYPYSTLTKFKKSDILSKWHTRGETLDVWVKRLKEKNKL